MHIGTDTVALLLGSAMGRRVWEPMAPEDSSCACRYSILQRVPLLHNGFRTILHGVKVLIAVYIDASFRTQNKGYQYSRSVDILIFYESLNVNSNRAGGLLEDTFGCDEAPEEAHLTKTNSSSLHMHSISSSGTPTGGHAQQGQRPFELQCLIRPKATYVPELCQQQHFVRFYNKCGTW